MFVRVKSWLRWFATWEPAQFRALWGALVYVLASVGLTVPAEVDGKVVAAIASIGALVALLQGWWTRRAVSPQIRVESLQLALDAATGKHAAPEQPGTIGVPRTEPYRD